MLMMSSSEDPFTTLSKLRSRHSREQGLLKGVYRFNGERVGWKNNNYPYGHFCIGIIHVKGGNADFILSSD